MIVSGKERETDGLLFLAGPDDDDDDDEGPPRLVRRTDRQTFQSGHRSPMLALPQRHQPYLNGITGERAAMPPLQASRK